MALQRSADPLLAVKEGREAVAKERRTRAMEVASNTMLVWLMMVMGLKAGATPLEALGRTST
jgi:hypothetical protein